ncbi:anti-phage DNA glycosylase Brig1 [Tessaracoccus defluvii]|uniref:Uncharacterized protein n=1 Tax=Tessaracoccus defluvii TaxID=1285901 RepID=A0A7H0H497_9ACTN|nr:hypothetical protein [Tessaracoccus defluvii]QNP55363.1 hypothetical protein H9L22_14275 [Tessaracoccus defluvii]
MSSRLAAVEFWDREIGLWVKGNHRLHPDLERWRATYSGRGAGTVDMTVMPEPYIGSLAGSATPALVMLGLNPGAPAPAFQSMDGIYTQRVRETSYSNWASSGPYTDATWQQAHGRNRYHHNRLAFARRLHNDDTIQNHDLLYIELYPFHSKAVTAAITPPPTCSPGSSSIPSASSRLHLSSPSASPGFGPPHASDSATGTNCQSIGQPPAAQPTCSR